ncbi:MAG: transglycosylase SLT domain-containing protein [Candidatus Omnitrophota bacterium]
MKLIKLRRYEDKREIVKRGAIPIPFFFLIFIFLTMTAGAGGSVFWIMKKDNEVEKERRVKIFLQNQIKERDILLQQNRQEIDQLKRRVEILDAIQELSKAELPENDKRKIAKEVDEVSQKYGYHPMFLLALMSTESSLRPSVESSKGAHGLMQLMPSTGRALTRQVRESPAIVGEEKIEAADLPHYREIEGNITLGALYLTKLMLQYKSLEKAVYAYNLGPVIYDKRVKEGGAMPRRYYAKIMSKYHKLVQEQERQEPVPNLYALDNAPLVARADPFD